MGRDESKPTTGADEPQLSPVKQSEELFRVMADIAPVMLWMSGTDKLCTYFNQGWLEFTGKSLEHELGHGWAKGVHPDDYDRCVEVYFEAFEARQAFRMEYRLLRADGQYRWILDSGAPRFNPAGGFAGFIGSCIDIDDQKRLAEVLDRRVNERTLDLARANADLAEARDRAVEASRAKSQFLANMSHEIRTPMHAVMGMLDLLLCSSLTEDQHKMAQVAFKSAQALLSVLNDILDLSKLEAGKLKLEMKQFDTRELIEGTVELMSDKARIKEITLLTEISRHTPLFMETDPGRLRQVLLNLVDNAIKFTACGRVVVRTSVECEGEVLRFSVHDTGVGVAEADLERLFEPFEQADGSTTRRFGGSGLGLSISKHLVELMGGKIGCESVPGTGSTFWFCLPIAKQAMPEDSGKLLATDQTSMLDARPARSSALILLAEDNPANRQLTLFQLQKLGYSASFVTNGEEAVAAYRDKQYSLLLMDCQMPVCDGFEATRAIRRLEQASGRRVPIIAITAHALVGVREQCLAAGMDDYITKPVMLADLKEMLAKWLAVGSAQS